MSDNDYDDDLYDPYADGNSGAGGAPVISWKYARPGEIFTGVVLPPEPVERPDKGYKMGREYQAGTDADPDDKGFMVWPPKNNSLKQKRPVTEMKFRELWPDEPIPTGRGKVSRVNVTLQTKYVAGEFLSDNAKARMTEDEVDPASETLRRVIISGGDLTPKIDAALKPLGGKPEPGQAWTIRLASREPNVGRQGSTSRYDVTILGPTDETRKLVADYVVAKQAEANAAADAADESDPYTSAEAASGGTPPF